MPRLAAVTASGDSGEAIELLDAVMTSLHGGDSAALQGPLYRYSDLNDLADLTSRMGALLLSEVENEDEYAFVRAVPAYRSFVEKWKAVGSVWKLGPVIQGAGVFGRERSGWLYFGSLRG